ncbi:MAG: hypothetical protein WAX29_10830 [Propionibacterium sp.]
MSGIDIDWIRAEFPAPEGSSRERAQIEVILRLCDEVERLWGEVQWQDLRGAVVGGMVSGMVDGKQARIDALDAAGRSLARELVREIHARRGDRDRAALAEISGAEFGSSGGQGAVGVVADLGAAHLGLDIDVDGAPCGRLLGISAAGSDPSRDAGPVHLSTERAELDVGLLTPCTITGPRG